MGDALGRPAPSGANVNRLTEPETGVWYGFSWDSVEKTK